MARFDHTDPNVGTFRARLEAAWPEADVGKLVAVGLNASGRVVRGAGNSGILGVVALGMVRNAGHPVDVMTSGEILDIATTDIPAVAAGTVYYANAAGDVVAAAPGIGVNGTRVGNTVEADRLVVRVQQVQGA